jgi:hypothetical protein
MALAAGLSLAQARLTQMSDATSLPPPLSNEEWALVGGPPISAYGNNGKHHIDTVEEPPAPGLSRILTRLVSVWEEPEPAPRRFTIEGLIPEGAVTSLFGDGGMGKSYLALYMAVLVCLGLPFTGRTVVKGRAIYIDGELDKTEFIRRAYKVARGLGLSAPPHGLYYLQLPGPLSDPGIQREVSGLVRGSDAVLTVLDSLTMSTYGADPKDAQAIIRVMKYLETLGTVLAIDHIGKAAPGANLSNYTQFGSAFKHHASRSQIQVVKADGGGLSLLHKKTNFGVKAAPTNLAMEFEADRVVITPIEATDERMAGIEDNLPAMERVCREIARYDDGATLQYVADELSLKLGTVKNYVTVLHKAGRAEPLGDGRWKARISVSHKS